MIGPKGPGDGVERAYGSVQEELYESTDKAKKFRNESKEATEGIGNAAEELQKRLKREDRRRTT